MKTIFNIVLIALIFLAVSSGVTKVILMQQEVDFFSQYGFTKPLLILFGIAQLIGGVLLGIPKSRVIGAVIVAITFLLSALMLLMASHVPMAIVSLVCTLLLGFVIKRSL